MSDFVDKYKLVTAQNNWGAVPTILGTLFCKGGKFKDPQGISDRHHVGMGLRLEPRMFEPFEAHPLPNFQDSKTFIHWCPCVTRLGKKRLYPRIGPGHRKLERANRPPPAAKGSDCSEGIRRRLSNLRHLTRFWSL